MKGHGGSTKRRRLVGALIAAALMSFGLVLPLGPASAAYEKVWPGYTQWQWASAPVLEQIEGLAVRNDGWLIVSMHGEAGPRFGDGFLHLVPPWGGKIDASNRFGQPLMLGEIVMRDGFLYGRATPPLGCPAKPESVPSALYRIDPKTGDSRVVATLEACRRPLAKVLAVHPKTADLVFLDAFDSTIVRYRPETGDKTPLVTGLAFEIHSISFSPDGELMFVGVHDTLSVHVYNSRGVEVARIESPKYADGIVYGTKQCFEGRLYLSMTRWPDRNPQVVRVATQPWGAREPTEIARELACSDGGFCGRGKQQTPMTSDRAGNLVVAQRSNVVVIGCKDSFKPPTKPAAPPPKPADVPVADPLPGAVGPRGSLLAPPGPGGAPALQNAPATQVQPGPQSAAQAGAQGAAAPNAVGLADAPADEPAFRLAASPLGSGFVPLWARLAAGAMLIVAMGSAAVVLERSRRPRVARARSNPWEGV